MPTLNLSGLQRPLAAAALFCAFGAVAVAAEAAPFNVKVIDGIVQPRRPVADAMADAILFLRKADGAYQPGNIQGELPGYFLNAHVGADGSRAQSRQLAFPARHHAYFIRTFLHYYTYTGQPEWLQRARDLADWNLAHSTPADCAYPNLPYSAWQNNKPTGSADKNSIEPDKPAFVGSAYLALFEATGDQRYLTGAKKIAATLIPKQRADGSWPFRVIPEDGKIYQDFGGAPVFFVEFFEQLFRHDPNPAYIKAREGALRCLIERHVEKGEWGTYHEDIAPKEGSHLSAEPMSFTADYLFRASQQHPEYLEMGRKILRQMEAKLVHTSGHSASPAPGVAEQATFAHIMAGHTARYVLALANLYRVTHDPATKSRALSALNATTYMQSDTGLFRTHFYDTKAGKEKDQSKVNNWYSQHLYTICHTLEVMPIFPELAPQGQDHVLGYSTALRDIRYAPGRVSYATMMPGSETVKLSFEPKSVQVAGRPLARNGQEEGWSYDAAQQVVVLRHAAGEVSIAK